VYLTSRNDDVYQHFIFIRFIHDEVCANFSFGTDPLPFFEVVLVYDQILFVCSERLAHDNGGFKVVNERNGMELL